jgi:hypothetical protein
LVFVLFQSISTNSFGPNPYPTIVTVLPAAPESGCRARCANIEKLAAASLPLPHALPRNTRGPLGDSGACAVVVNEPLPSATALASTRDPTPWS